MGFSTVLVTAPALAHGESRETQLAVRQAQKSCPELDCTDLRAKIKTLSRQESENLDPETKQFLRAAAQNFAQDMWPDTILESSYEVEFRVRLENLEILTLDNHPVGYRVLFSAAAWNRDDCPVFTENEMAQKPILELIKEKCQSGRIYDRTFAVAGSDGVFDDEKFRARFK